jgi:hypothetical protein
MCWWKKRNLKVIERPPVDWSKDKIADSLQAIFEYCMETSDQAIRWYVDSRRGKRFWARATRLGAIILAALAAMLPTIDELISSLVGFEIRAGWSVLLLGVVGVLLLLDRFFGLSTGWIRYITSELQLRQIAQEFHMDWEAGRSELGDNDPDDQYVKKMLDLCRAHITLVNKLIRDETQAWKCEFESALKQIDEFSKAKAAQSEFGALNLTVINGEDATGGWTLSIDDGPPETRKGKTFSKKNLTPGQHQIKIKGEIGGNLKKSEKVIVVPPGGSIAETLTLE